MHTTTGSYSIINMIHNKANPQETKVNIMKESFMRMKKALIWERMDAIDPVV